MPRSFNIVMEAKKMIKSVIFDIDNTLYDYDSANSAAMTAIEDYALENFGRS